jgi:ubiquinone/menaquinone biosynthesis C-methylase UbiE
VEEYNELVESRYVAPNIVATDHIREIGVGGGKTSAMLKKHCSELVCADISAEMLKATRERLGDEGVRYVKLDV